MNKVVHFEIPYDNIDRVKTFYENVFGWKINEIPAMNYHMVTTVQTDEKQMPKESGAINGGMYKRGMGGSQTPVIVIDVPSIDAYIEKVKAAGGTIVFDKRKVGDMGFYAQIKDTEGNIVGIWQTTQ